jgi:hypothetical protein
MQVLWSIVIFIVNGKANHVGLSTQDNMLIDLSLRGSRFVSWNSDPFPESDKEYYDISVPQYNRSIEFFQKPALLMPEIINKEKENRGWHLTKDAPDYVRKYRSKRSRDVTNMNCVEWILYGLDLGEVVLPNDILTPGDLHLWCLKGNL